MYTMRDQTLDSGKAREQHMLSFSETTGYINIATSASGHILTWTNQARRARQMCVSRSYIFF